MGVYEHEDIFSDLRPKAAYISGIRVQFGTRSRKVEVAGHLAGQWSNRFGICGIRSRIPSPTSTAVQS